ncbi:sensor histidine kinase inhibitor, KipI family [Pseudoxanthobacter soli DSM 19599]|uniref:Sensor histidine kinase inhibitor, KipI family n=2 Tax=Pseudoxanthobacter TaxID=433838 RepID=A0A1M7ZS27_9HYPH|nr:sensor histidine kinase inhibitor, KipI family [Pseudoxanthobacter soli DSM 19599]
MKKVMTNVLADPHAIELRFLDAGDSGLVIELGATVDAAVNAAVIALDAALARLALPAIRETVPTYRSLLVLFDPVRMRRPELIGIVRGLWPPAPLSEETTNHWIVPVLYGGESGVDLDHVAEVHGMTPQEVVALHSSVDYRVYMIGFAPGFAYLGGLPAAIHTSRRTDPRRATPPRSISIGGQQTAVSPPIAIPSGWHLIGQTPVRSYDPARSERPFLFAAGDTIRFRPIDEDEYRTLVAAAEAGDEVAERRPATGASGEAA